jgi:hypothetical protein
MPQQVLILTNEISTDSSKNEDPSTVTVGFPSSPTFNQKMFTNHLIVSGKLLTEVFIKCQLLRLSPNGHSL